MAQPRKRSGFESRSWGQPQVHFVSFGTVSLHTLLPLHSAGVHDECLMGLHLSQVQVAGSNPAGSASNTRGCSSTVEREQPVSSFLVVVDPIGVSPHSVRSHS
jgi:hypothetical protein